MTDLSIETLMAFADGELSPAEHARVLVTIRRNPALDTKVQAFLATRKITVFDAVLSEPIPEALIAAVYAPQPAKGQDFSSRQLPQGVSLGERIRQAMAWLWPSGETAGWQLGRGLAVASALLLVAGGTLLFRAPATQGATRLIVADGGQLLATGTLQRSLETAPSRVRVKADTEAGAGWTVRMVNTFTRHDRSFCRQYELIGGAEQAREVGFACRTGDGKWQVQAQARADAVGASPDAQVVPLAGDEPPAGLDKWFEDSRAGDVLGGASEKAVIQNGWHAN